MNILCRDEGGINFIIVYDSFAGVSDWLSILIAWVSMLLILMCPDKTE